MAVNTTSVSLLDRLRRKEPDDADWLRLQDIYLPLIRKWLGRVPDLGDEAPDVAQDVFVVLVREVPHFERRRKGSFRAWLRQITVNRVRNHRKRCGRAPAVGFDPAAGFLDRLEDPAGDLAQEWDRDHDRHVFDKLVRVVRPDFQPASWVAFQRCVLDGVPVSRAAAELGLTENAVLQAKYRVLKRLREEAGQLLE
jgi:RNA polymerase sigma-70 factor (ECF subfamily)